MKGFPGSSSGKESTCNVGDPGSIPGLGNPWGHGKSLQYSCLENSHGQRSMEGSSPWGLDTMQWLSTAQLNEIDKEISVISVTQSCPTVCDPMNRSMPGLPVHHQLLDFTQTHVHQVGDAIQPSQPLLSTSPPAPNTSQHQGLFQWVNSSHQVAKVLEFQLQHQSFQWTPRTDLL